MHFKTLLVAIAALSLAACGSISESSRHVVQVDSVRVSAPQSGSAYARLTFYGTLGNNSCAELAGVQRATMATDTVSWQFVATRGGNNCFQAIEPLRYVDSVLNQPARTFQAVVLQPSGDPLRQSFALPVGSAN